MVSVERCRRILGRAAAGMSDAEIRKARDQLYILARVAIRMHLDRTREGVEGRQRKKCSRGLDKQERRGIME